MAFNNFELEPFVNVSPVPLLILYYYTMLIYSQFIRTCFKHSNLFKVMLSSVPDKFPLKDNLRQTRCDRYPSPEMFSPWNQPLTTDTSHWTQQLPVRSNAKCRQLRVGPTEEIKASRTEVARPAPTTFPWHRPVAQVTPQKGDGA